jgi:E3 ubiquitin-protein ligase ATL6/9/15/31/42/55
MASPAGGGVIPGPAYNNPNVTLASDKFNPTMAVIIIVLIGGCFILGFISVFVRKCMGGEAAAATTTAATEQSPGRTAKARGLDKAAVDALPIVHTADLDEKYDVECPVCLTEFEPEDTLRLLPVCKHVFHQECIDAWFDAHSTCPLCRASLTGQEGAVGANSPGEPTRAPLDTEAAESDDCDIELQPDSDAPPRDGKNFITIACCAVCNFNSNWL